ncbi:hypothetical protein [Nonomuraea ferruginea]|uniref:Uncharacterized protein n=1 Tax=Nonomuraea ferruginea TaxID=46174 RepID=A0ABT4TCR7_9ACTN|nr:hypothetical protein [Nonomuraea ferruginea]MDA0647278.1 hypothetical protein [Nonomuraea ferruginea]
MSVIRSAGGRVHPSTGIQVIIRSPTSRGTSFSQPTALPNSRWLRTS